MSLHPSHPVSGQASLRHGVKTRDLCYGAAKRRLAGALFSSCRTGLVIAGLSANLPRIGGEEGQMSTYHNWVPSWLARIACRVVGKRSAVPKAVQQPAALDPARIEEKS